MTDPRYKKLADLLVNYSTTLRKGERILLDMVDVPDEFTIALIRAVRAAGALPFVETRHTRVGRELLRDSTEAQAAQQRDIEMFRMKRMQAYIAVRGSISVGASSRKTGFCAFARLTFLMNAVRSVPVFSQSVGRVFTTCNR